MGLTPKGNKGSAIFFLGLVGLLFTLAIICYVSYLQLNIFFKRSPSEKKPIDSATGQLIDTSNYRSIVNSTRTKINEITSQRNNELDKVSGLGD